jgi:hypothetical protein
MLTPTQAALLAGTTPKILRQWIAQARVIALPYAGSSFRLPRWQFEPHVWAALPALRHALGAAPCWALLAFLETPLGALGGRTPRQAIEQGEVVRAIELAGEAGP